MKPNIIFICSDQQGAYALGRSNPNLQTPNLDRLAASGITFTRAYCTYPLCTPARASHFSGRLPHQVGVNGNGEALGGDARTMLGSVMRAAGYKTVWAGKWHLPEWYPSRADAVPGFEAVPLQSGPDDATVDRLYTDQAVQFIETAEARPFFISLQLHNPHQICKAFHDDIPDAPARLGDDALLPPVPPAEPLPEEPEVISMYRLEEMKTYRKVRKWRGRDWQRFRALAEKVLVPDGMMPDAEAARKLAAMRRDRWDEHTLRRYRYHYYRLTETVDVQVGRVLDALGRRGLLENTLIIFTSDHGEGAGKHQWLRKLMFYEELVNVPFIISWPGTIPAGRVDHHLVSGTDLLPTFCDYGGGMAHEDWEGHSLRPVIENPAATIREELVVELQSLQGSRAWTGRMLVTESHKYMLFDRGARPDMLFDLKTDPGETVNLSRQHGRAPLESELRARLLARCRATGDHFSPRS